MLPIAGLAPLHGISHPRWVYPPLAGSSPSVWLNPSATLPTPAPPKGEAEPPRHSTRSSFPGADFRNAREIVPVLGISEDLSPLDPPDHEMAENTESIKAT
jgi:hypothetical protein